MNVIYEYVYMMDFTREDLKITNKLSSEMLDQVEDIDHNNYYIFESISKMLTLIKHKLREIELWKMLFDRAKYNN